MLVQYVLARGVDPRLGPFCPGPEDRMASPQAGVAVAIIGAVGLIAAACLTSGAYKAVCPQSICGSATQESGQQSGGPGPGGGNPGDTGRGEATPERAADACADGYVWREAVPDDHVCVTPERREEIRAQNQDPDAHRNQNGGQYGVETCEDGYVWREAADGDHICVTPEERDKVAEENQHPDQHRAG